MRTSLDRVFAPRSIAVVGASLDPTKRGYQILRGLDASGFDGDVYPVNPRGGEILGRAVVLSVGSLPHGVDLAVLCTPAASAPDLVRACGERGVGGAIVLAVGFRESGEAGRVLEAELHAAATESGVRILGPNTSGMLNPGALVNLVGARGVRKGGIALLVQSGNIALSLMTEATERSWDGISFYLGLGNQLDVGFAEALDFLERHDDTRSIILYLEGVTHARDFLRSAARVSRTKPIVAIKSGRTAQGAAAALSHTGSVAGPYERFSAALRQVGVVEVERTDELLHVAETLGNQPAGAPGSGIAVLSDGGGQGTLAMDTLAEAGAEFARLQASTEHSLRTLLGPAAAANNPVDLAGRADAEPMIFAKALQLVLDDPGVGCVLVVGLFGGYGVRFSEQLAEEETEAGITMAICANEAGKGLVMHSMYAAHRTPALEALGTRGVPVVASLEVACRCVAELQRRGGTREQEPWGESDDGPDAGERHDAATVVDNGVGEGPPVATEGGADRPARSALSEPEARELLREHGLRFAPYQVVSSADDAADVVAALDGPAALKLVSRTIVHKSDAGGVRLDVSSRDGAREAFEAIASNSLDWLNRHGHDAERISVMVSRMSPYPRVELLIGGYRDEQLGPVLTIGAGGIWVEALADVTHRVLPISDDQIALALSDLRIASLLRAGRGKGAVDIGPIVVVARAVASLLEKDGRVEEVELNPLFVYDKTVEPVDARVVIRDRG